MEEYEISQSEFSSNFVNDFIMQTSKSLEQSVDIDKALSQMSPYKFDKDFKPHVVKKELEKMLEIEKLGSKSHIVLGEQWDDSSKTSTKVGG